MSTPTPITRDDNKMYYTGDLLLEAQQRIAELTKAMDEMAESECDKIMAMSEDQISALTRLEGRNPDDVARLGKQACELALKTLRIEQLEAEIAACKKNEARWQEVVKRISGSFGQYQMRWPSCRGVDLMRGSVAGHFTAGIDAAIAAQERTTK